MQASSDQGGATHGAKAVEQVQAAAGVGKTVAGWLVRRGLTEPGTLDRFLDPKLAHLTPPDTMVDRDVAAKRIAEAIRAKQQVAVFGDYDCDGITSAAIMTEVIRTLGGRAVPLLASRFRGGYGVSEEAVRDILATKPALLITCDCGSSDHRSLEKVTAAGVDVVVIDHHLVPDEALPAVAFLNPHRPDCGFAYKGLASCGLALSMAAALRKELGAKLDIRRWLDLVAIGTVADVAPLDGDNRALVKAGLQMLARTQRPGLRALLELAKVDCSIALTGRDIGFRVAPQINAPGRMGHPDIALELLLEQDEDKAVELASKIRQISDERRARQEEIIAEATAEIEAEGYAKQGAIVVGREGWNHGIVGIVAGRLADRHQKATIVIGFDGEVGTGSVRGPKGVSLHDALSEISDCLERFGGHHAAAGLSVKFEKLGELRERFATAIESQVPQSSDAGEADYLTLQAGDDAQSLLKDLDRLEPCGEANPRPTIKVEGTVVSAREVRGGHLKLELRLSKGARLGGFAIGMGSRAQELTGPVRISGDLRRNTFRGAPPVEMFVEKIESLSDSDSTSG